MKTERRPSDRLQELDARHDQAIADLDALQGRLEAALAAVRPAATPPTEPVLFQSSGVERPARKTRQRVA
jgi:hypothetical protein